MYIHIYKCMYTYVYIYMHICNQQVRIVNVREQTLATLAAIGDLRCAWSMCVINTCMCSYICIHIYYCRYM